MALNGLMRSDPDRALTALDSLLKSRQSPKLKEQALFVLAQNNSPKAQQMLEQVARGSGNPDLQVKAISFLVPLRKEQPDRGQVLSEIYDSTNDVNVKRAAISALWASRDADRLLRIAKTEKSPELRADIMRKLSGSTEMGDAEANSMVQIYASEQDKTVKRAMVDTLASHSQVKQMVAVARSEKDPEMVRYIVTHLANMKSPEAADYLMEIIKK